MFKGLAAIAIATCSEVAAAMMSAPVVDRPAVLIRVSVP